MLSLLKPEYRYRGNQVSIPGVTDGSVDHYAMVPTL